MVIGAIILLVGIGIGYSIPFWKMPGTVKLDGHSYQSMINNLVKNKQGIIVDLTPPIELDPIENEKENPIA